MRRSTIGANPEGGKGFREHRRSLQRAIHAAALASGGACLIRRAPAQQNAAMNRIMGSLRRRPRVRQALLVLAAFLQALVGSALEEAVPLEKALNERVLQLLKLHRFEEAKETARTAVEKFSSTFGRRYAATATSLRNLALCHSFLREYAEAEPLFLEAVEIREQLYGPKDIHTLETLGELADLYERAGAYPKAELVLKRVLAVQEPWGQKNVMRARTLQRLGVVYTGLGRFEEAEALLTQVREINESAFGEKFLGNARCIHDQARLKQAMEKYVEAELLYRKALAMIEKARGPTHPDTAIFLNNLGTLYSAMGDYEKAEPLYQRALANLTKAYGPKDPDAQICLHNLAMAQEAARKSPRPKSQSAITI
jgi:tetratricopeptide (TPR) repeat protein